MTGWIKSSRSYHTGACVEVRAAGPDRVEVRDSKDPDGPVLVFDIAEWEAFLAGVAAGEFDTPDTPAGGDGGDE